MKQIAKLTCLLVLAACSPQPETSRPNVKPPMAAKRPYEIVAKHGHKRVDNYYWLKEREDTAVLNYLKAENRYLDTMTASTRPLR